MLLFFSFFICDQPTELHWQGFSHVCAVSFSSAWDPIQNCLNLKSWPVVNVKTAHEKHEHQVFLKHRDPAGLFLNRCLWSDSLNLWLISLFFPLWLCNQKIADRKHVEAVFVSEPWVVCGIMLKLITIMFCETRRTTAQLKKNMYSCVPFKNRFTASHPRENSWWLPPCSLSSVGTSGPWPYGGVSRWGCINPCVAEHWQISELNELRPHQQRC